MIKIIFLYFFLVSLLMSENFYFNQDNNLSKEQKIFQEQAPKRIKIPTH